MSLCYKSYTFFTPSAGFTIHFGLHMRHEAAAQALTNVMVLKIKDLTVRQVLPYDGLLTVEMDATISEEIAAWKKL
jgi:hypothetical protein